MWTAKRCNQPRPVHEDVLCNIVSPFRATSTWICHEGHMARTIAPAAIGFRLHRFEQFFTVRIEQDTPDVPEQDGGPRDLISICLTHARAHAASSPVAQTCPSSSSAATSSPTTSGASSSVCRTGSCSRAVASWAPPRFSGTTSSPAALSCVLMAIGTTRDLSCLRRVAPARHSFEERQLSGFDKEKQWYPNCKSTVVSVSSFYPCLKNAPSSHHTSIIPNAPPPIHS